MADAKKTAKVTKAASEVKTIEQLREELATLKAEQLASRKSHQQGDLVNPRVLTTQRKAIARINTAITAALRASQKEEK